MRALTGEGGRLRRRAALEYGAAFALPAVLMVGIFALLGVYPFGEKTLLVVDMSSEYVDYLTYLNRAVRDIGGRSILRTWSMGMGLDMLGLVAFYAASPFALIAVLLPVRCITEAIFLITVLKFGCCGLLFHVYARRCFQADFVWNLICSTAYAMMGYAVAYSSNIMWLDGVLCLPIVLCGVERLLWKQKSGLLLAGYIYVFVTCYYIGYMVGIYSVLYMALRYFSVNQSGRAFGRRLVRLLATAALAAGCCAFLLLPAFRNLQNGQAGLWEVPLTGSLRYSVTQLSRKLLPGYYDSLTDAALPNLYCSLPGVFLGVLFFLRRSIPRKEKLLCGGMLAGLWLSFSWEPLNLAWHAFEDPTWFPARYSFVFPAFVLYMGLRCVEEKQPLRAEWVGAAFGVALILIGEAALADSGGIDRELATVAVMLAAAYAGLLLPGGKGGRYRAVALTVLLCGELGYSGYRIIGGIDEQFHYGNRAAYRTYMDKYEAAVEQLPEGGPYRTEIAAPRNSNGGLAFGYYPVSHYSTTTNQTLNGFLRRLAFNSGTLNDVRFAPGSPLASGALGVKYLLSETTLGPAYALFDTVGEVGIYENRYALPLAYYAESLPDLAVGDNPFAVMNTMYREPLYVPLEWTAEPVNCTLTRQQSGLFVAARQIRGEKAAVRYTVHNPEGREVSVWLQPMGRRFSRAALLWGEKGEEKTRVLGYRNNPIVSVGAEETVSLVVEFEGDYMSYAAVYAFGLDSEGAAAATDAIDRDKMEVTVFADTRVDGVVHAPEDGYLATTFPWDAGWSVTVNGERVTPVKQDNIFLYIPLEAGRSEIRMRYHLPGWRMGCCISAVSMAGVGILLWMRKKYGWNL
ncbi:YfhO family protein [Ruminococcaceae bacterium OttesenSCG-928-L11]|nr:YfhO family protein [Ruminococcaceae bacterium OttesenSCG-928-L11]